MSYARNICSLSRRGDIEAIADSMKGYFEDKRAHPWHRLVQDIEKYSAKGDEDELAEMMLLLRAGVFSAMGILSLAVPLDTSTSEILEVFTNQIDLTTGRREVRSLCSGAVQELIEKRELRHLVSSALERDGFGYLVDQLDDARWDEFVKAEPKVKRGKLDLTALEESALGSRFLAEQGVSELKIPKDDPRVSGILEAYEHSLVEYEIERSSRLPLASETEQVTLNGKPVDNQGMAKDRKRGAKPAGEEDEQPELTDFIGKETTTQQKESRKKGKKGRRK